MGIRLRMEIVWTNVLGKANFFEVGFSKRDDSDSNASYDHLDGHGK